MVKWRPMMTEQPKFNPPFLEPEGISIDGKRVLIAYPNGTYAAECHDADHAESLAQDMKRYVSAMNVPASFGGIERLLAEMD